MNNFGSNPILILFFKDSKIFFGHIKGISNIFCCRDHCWRGFLGRLDSGIDSEISSLGDDYEYIMIFMIWNKMETWDRTFKRETDKQESRNNESDDDIY